MPRSAAHLTRIVVVAAIAALMVSLAGPAYAKKHIFGGAKDDHSATVEVTQTHQTQHQGSTAQTESAAGVTGSTSSPYPEPGPYGSWDDAFPKNPNADLSWMPGAVDACGSNWGGDGWNAKYATATPCAPTEDEEEEGPPQITTEMVTAAATVVAPRTPPHVQPGTVSYVHIPNNYWADAPTVNNSVTLLGVTIPLRWVPVATSWDFGDGGTATGEGIRSADVGEAGAIEHAYDRQGTYAISTTTAYDLTFVIPGAGAQTVRLTSPPSAAVQLPIREIQTRTSYVG